MSPVLPLDRHANIMLPGASIGGEKTGGIAAGIGSGRAAIPAARIVAKTWRDFDHRTTIAAWDALAQWAVEPNPFYESWFLLPSLTAFDRLCQVRLLVLEVGGQFAGLMPVVREKGYYGRPIPHWRNWAHANCFLGQPLVARGFERLFWRELLRWSDKADRMAMFLHLAHVAGKGPLHEALIAELASQNRQSKIVMREERALLASAKTPQAYLTDALSPKKRKELRRQRRRLEELGKVTIERDTSALGVQSWVSAFLTLEERGWKGAAGSALACDTRTADLFSDALGGAARRGKLERLSLRLDGKPIAMLASFLTTPGAYSFKTAFDEDYARFSPGVLLQLENLAMLEREDVDWVDSCAAPDHPMIDHLWCERREIARHSIAVGGPVRRAAFSALARLETGASPDGLA